MKAVVIFICALLIGTQAQAQGYEGLFADDTSNSNNGYSAQPGDDSGPLSFSGGYAGGGVISDTTAEDQQKPTSDIITIPKANSPYNVFGDQAAPAAGDTDYDRIKQAVDENSRIREEENRQRAENNIKKRAEAFKQMMLEKAPDSDTGQQPAQ